MSEVPNWRYVIRTAISIDEINQLGANGWELVSVVFSDKWHYFFKRQVVK